MKTIEQINNELNQCKKLLKKFKLLREKEERILGLPSQYNNSINRLNTQISTLKWILK